MFLFSAEYTLQKNLFKNICINYTFILQNEIIANADRDRTVLCHNTEKFWTIKYRKNYSESNELLFLLLNIK